MHTSSPPPGTPVGDHLDGSDQLPSVAAAQDFVHDGVADAAVGPRSPVDIRATVSTDRKTTMTNGRRLMSPSLCGKPLFLTWLPKSDLANRALQGFSNVARVIPPFGTARSRNGSVSVTAERHVKHCGVPGDVKHYRDMSGIPGRRLHPSL